LCNDTTYTTIYVRDIVAGTEPDPVVEGVHLFPNPGTGQLTVVVENELRGPATLQLLSILGIEVTSPVIVQKTGTRLVKTFDTSSLVPGIYVVNVKIGERSVVKKWVRY